MAVLALSLAAAAEAVPGDPLPALSPAHLVWFNEGAAAFSEEYVAEDGLGPIFNDRSCVACHSTPAPGGGSERTVTRFGRSESGNFDPLVSMGGPLLQAQAIDPACVETVPAEANVIVGRLTTPMFGAGLIEAIPDEDIAALADPGDSDGDGISGRLHMVQYPGRPRVGRFGWKSQEATLLSFSSDAMVSEMGLTNALAPGTTAPGGDVALLAACEAIEGRADPEDAVGPEGFTDLVKVTNFARLLAPPTPSVRPTGRGWRLFRRARCETCHVARWNTGSHTVEELAFVRFYPYSDFLLHDMGALGDGIVQGAAAATEMRTAPLWGIGARTRYLHDGRATSLLEAVQAHGGEAAASRARFDALPAVGKRKLLDFVAGR
ncbi:MAG: hypothetical protein HY899_13905 [Deltaproteobacteria bacterium]|nr:hypothetical protein [Deltaproteobacteria bacterium]